VLVARSRGFEAVGKIGSDIERGRGRTGIRTGRRAVALVFLRGGAEIFTGVSETPPPRDGPAWQEDGG